ncbi:glycosyltransferase family protein, partial [Nitrosomonas sp.]|uniref:glycosyltransferase family protein n=1 Tax=Nitrosomonas sp. TaxID=42353 RepID=UPI0025EA8AD2
REKPSKMTFLTLFFSKISLCIVQTKIKSDRLLACGGIVVTNPGRAVTHYFRDYCHVVNSGEEARELLARLRYGPSRDDMARAEAGAAYVRRNHTWEHRLKKISDVVNL